MTELESASWIGRRVHVVVDRPLGSAHPDDPDMVYEPNYGISAGGGLRVLPRGGDRHVDDGLAGHDLLIQVVDYEASTRGCTPFVVGPVECLGMESDPPACTEPEGA